MYGKIFEEIFDSTIIAAGGDVVYVFISMIVLSDDDGLLPITAAALAARIAKPLELVQQAISSLEQPDPNSNTPDYDGRRIITIKELTDGKQNRGWWVVNKKKFAKTASRNDRKTHMREAWHEKYKKNKALSTTRQPYQNLSKLDHTDTDTDTDIKQTTLAHPDARFDVFWGNYPKKKNKGDAKRAFVKLRVSDDLLARMLTAIETAKISEDWKKEGGQFIPYPASWLRAEGWEDQAPEKELSWAQKKRLEQEGLKNAI